MLPKQPELLKIGVTQPVLFLHSREHLQVRGADALKDQPAIIAEPLRYPVLHYLNGAPLMLERSLPFRSRGLTFPRRAA